jgi:hypothetical protein
VKANAGRGRLSRSYRPHSLQLLILRDADLTIRARVPGHHERPRRSPRRLRRRVLRDLPATLATNGRQKLLRLIAERRIKALDISADW